MIIEQLMKHCRQVTITLTLDRAFHGQAPDELHLFRLSGENCRTLYEMASVNGIISGRNHIKRAKKVAG